MIGNFGDRSFRAINYTLVLTKLHVLGTEQNQLVSMSKRGFSGSQVRIFSFDLSSL